MQYFIPITKTKHHLWQTELLLQSLKDLGLFDDAILAIVDQPQEVRTISPNVTDCKKFLVHDHQEANLIACLLTARQQFLKPPYTILHPDMVLRKPIECGASVAFDRCGRGLPAEYQDELRKILPKNTVIPAGGIITINEEPSNFLDQLVHWAKRMFEVKRDKMAVRAAFIAATWEGYSRQIHVDKLSSELTEHDLTSAIHYFRGLPPNFHKNMFGDEVYLSGSPFDALLETNPTANTEFVQKVIRGYLKKSIPATQTTPKTPEAPIGVIID